MTNRSSSIINASTVCETTNNQLLNLQKSMFTCLDKFQSMPKIGTLADNTGCNEEDNIAEICYSMVSSIVLYNQVTKHAFSTVKQTKGIVELK